jgi:Xaa-Pro aminopeptidase
LVSGFLNRRHANRLMLEQGLSALVLAQPESIIYAAGAFPGVATNWRRAGAAFLVVPCDALEPLTAIVGDLQAGTFKTHSGIADVRSHPIWVETGQYDNYSDPENVARALVEKDMAMGKRPRQPRPAQFDPQTAIALLRDALAERNLLNQRIGLEMAFVAARDFAMFTNSMPNVSWMDATNLVERLRAIKAPQEIAYLRTAAELARAGLTALTQAITPGMNANQMTAIWRAAALAEAHSKNLPPPASMWAYIAVGGDGFAPGGPVHPGDLVKIDVGCVIEGYSSDGGRTAVLGRAGRAAQKVYDALHKSFDAGLALLRPGVALNEVYRAVATNMWDAGFTTYGRGHFGHGVGASIWSEEWPFISADATAVAEPGMVLAFETPYYIKGLGGFIIEDQILITENGVHVMAASSRNLIEVR